MHVPYNADHLFKFRNFRWQSDKSQIEVLKALVNAVQQIKATDDTGAFYDIHKVI